MKPAITKEILLSYFAGTSTALQKKLIEAWVKEGDNRELFFQWLFEWEQKNVQYHVSVDAGIERHRKWVLSLKDHDEPAVVEIQKNRFSGLRRWWIAASVVLLCASLGWVTKEKILFCEFSTKYGEIKKMTLSDGSKVVLNANSTLKVPRIAFKDSREVYLAGEASFDVIHTSDHRRFLVHANDGVKIEVLGTTFNVYTRSSGTKIMLEEGKVRLNYKEGDQRGSIIMQPGDLATVDPDGSFRMTHTEQPGQYTAWKYHRFIFDDLPFSEVGQKLEEVFGTRIIIENEALAAEPVTGSFPALDAEELLDVLKEAKGFSYTRKGNEIMIVSEENAP